MPTFYCAHVNVFFGSFLTPIADVYEQVETTLFHLSEARGYAAGASARGVVAIGGGVANYNNTGYVRVLDRSMHALDSSLTDSGSVVLLVA